MKKMIPILQLVTLLCLGVTSSCNEDEGECPVTATIVEIGADCGYRYFQTSNGFLHPDQDVLQELQALNPNLDLGVGATVQLGFTTKETFDMRCLILFADATPINITCITVDGADVAIE